MLGENIRPRPFGDTIPHDPETITYEFDEDTIEEGSYEDTVEQGSDEFDEETSLPDGEMITISDSSDEDERGASGLLVYYERHMESVEQLKQCFLRSGWPEDEMYEQLYMESLEKDQKSELREYVMYEQFMKSLKDFKPSVSDATLSKYLGPLSAEKLPCDAWKKWCDDGVHVVCFGLSGPDVLKIYFGDPRCGSVYHVVDFVYSNYPFKLHFQRLHVAYTLFGSKIYVFCHYNDWHAMPVHIYHCDVAKPSLDGECYKWEDGPMLNYKKHRPLFFSLAGSLYVFGFCVSTRRYVCSLEVLKPNSGKWETLDLPPFLKQEHKDPLMGDINGTLVCEAAKKILIWVGNQSFKNFLCIYDAEQNEWKQVQYPFEDDPSSCSDDSFLDVITESYACHAWTHKYARDYLTRDSKDPLDDSFRRNLLKCLLSCMGDKFFHLTCVNESQTTFMLRLERSVEYPRKLLGSGPTIWEYKSIDFPCGLCLVPCSADKKTGSFITGLI